MTPNIQSLQYDQGALPFGFRAGELQGFDAVSKQMANSQGLQEQNLSNVLKEVEARRAQADYSNPEMERLRQGATMGQHQSQIATGKFDTATVDGRIEETLAKQLAGKSKAQVEQELADTQRTYMGIEQIEAAGEATGYSGLQFEHSAGRLAQQMGAPPQVVQAFLQAPPEQRRAILKGLKDSAQKTLTMVPSVMQKMAEQAQQGQITEGIHVGDRLSQQKVAAGNNAATIEAARIAAESRLAAAKLKEKATDIISQAQAGKLTYEKAAVALEMMSRIEPDPATALRYSQMAAAFTVAEQKSRASGRQVPVDLSAMGIQTQSITPSLGTGAPKSDTGEIRTQSGNVARPVK